jgi:hypothetical protein
MKQHYPFVLLALVLLSLNLQAQSFVNGTLDGVIGVSSTPTSWQQVAFGDPICTATQSFGATSDVTGTSGPFSGNINGNPYHGTTLVSGLHMQNGVDIWHEGIQQTVSGLTVGQAYTISLYQNVIKQSNGTDPTGCWSVYREGTLIALTAVCTDNSAVGSNAHPWFRRTVTFTAASTSHLIKFLPRDDDANIVSPNGVRMGIDSITIFPATVFPVAVDFSLELLEGNAVAVDWEDAESHTAQGYVVEHSPDGIHFEESGRVDAGQQQTYGFLDEAPFIESFYRIGRIAMDGGIAFTEVKHITTQAPVEAALRGRMLEVWGGYGGEYEVALMDMQGRAVFSQAVPSTADLTLLAQGIYFLRVVSPGKENAMLEKKIFLD